MGREREHGQHVLYDVAANSVVQARTIMTLPNAQKWSKDDIAAMQATPANLHESRKPDVVFQEHVTQLREEASKPRIARRVYIRASDIRQYGYTSGCPRCEHEMRYGPGRTAVSHSERCRTRIMEELAKSEAGKIRLGDAATRLDRSVAELGQQFRGDIENPAAAQGESVAVRNQLDASNPFRIDELLVPSAGAHVEPSVDVDTVPAIVADSPDDPAGGDGGDFGDSGGMDLGIHERCVASGKPVLVGNEGCGSNCEGRHHMSSEPIGELCGPRTEMLVGSKAALATDPRTKPGEARAFDSGHRTCSRDCRASPSVPIDAGVGGDSQLTASTESTTSGIEELESALNLLQRDQVQKDDRAVLAIVRQLGGDTNRYIRDRRSAVHRLVSEIYSPPRVTTAAKLLPELRCVPGFALNITTNDENGHPWDFSIEANRRRARERVITQKPMLLVGSPMCTAFSAWQHINNRKRDPTIVSREYVQAMVHMRFCMELYELQHKADRYFLHEHPASAMSWAEPEIRRNALMPNVTTVIGDQYQYEAQDKEGRPIKNNTLVKLSAAGAAGEEVTARDQLEARTLCAMVGVQRMRPYTRSSCVVLY